MNGRRDRRLGSLREHHGHTAKVAARIPDGLRAPCLRTTGRDQIWLPLRWRRLELAGDKRQRFITALMKMIRRLERFSRPRLRFVFDHRLSNIIFGLLVIGGSLAAFFAPPFTGLDTLPSLGVVLLSLRVLLEDFIVVVLGLVVGAAGIVLAVVLGNAAINSLGNFL